MNRRQAARVWFGGLAGVLAFAQKPQAPAGPSVADKQMGIARQLDTLERRGPNGGSQQQYARDVDGLLSGFRGLTPLFGSFTPHDYETNRELVRRSMAWLGTIEPYAVRDAGLGRSVAGAYGYFGDYQSQPSLRPYGYGGGAGLGYAGAGRMSRRMWLGGHRDFDRDIERYAMSMAYWSAGWYGTGGMQRQREPQGLDAADFALPPTDRRPMPLPDPDANVPEAKRQQWRDLAPQFGSVAGRIFEAQRNLDALAQRLARRGMTVNARDLATSYQMQGFLEDAAELVRLGDIDKAKLALDRAAYTCNQLKPVTGQ